MARIAAGVEYHGAAYCGWQSQPAAPSVQARVEQALSRVADSPVAVVCAGRTDAGVHALSQVIHFDTEARRAERAWVLGANSHLPPDISLRWARPVPQDFHARFSATARAYRYLILNRGVRPAVGGGLALCVYQRLDAGAMQAAAELLVGEHDFSAFRAAECQARSPVRRIRSLSVRRDGELLVVDVTANAFLHHMVRNIVGLLLVVGKGEAPPSRAAEQLQSRNRASGEATAAAHGLYLSRVEYPGQFGLPDESAIIAPLITTGGSHVLV
ncbi:MAG TPA: tRNA pseudouridine(38-40) synthase TruA [Steroidobacteraceae bacterium]|nr:tRNA pseudouridine(38-40) synthase TruA [Steroidobacteraceae bacterium]